MACNPTSRPGPAAVPPKYTLISSGLLQNDGDDRWLNGVCLDPAPCGPSLGHASVCPPDAPMEKESDSAEPLAEPCFCPFSVYHPDSCISAGAADDSFSARLLNTHRATRHYPIECEFWSGDLHPGQPHLTGPTANVINPGAPVSSLQGLSLLEACIADSGRRGYVHMTQEAFTKLACSCGSSLIDDSGSRIRTLNGNVIVPGTGYKGDGGSTLPPPGPNQEYMVATGPVMVWLSEPELLPRDFNEAFDTRTNMVTYRAESTALAAWDLCLHCVVLIDLCAGDC